MKLNDVELSDVIREFVADAADCALEDVGNDTNIFDELEVDSLGIVAILIDVAYTFDVPEPTSEAAYKSMDSVRKIAEYVRRGPAS